MANNMDKQTAESVKAVKDAFETPQYSEAELRIIWSGLKALENSGERAAKKARDDGKPAIAEAIMADTTKTKNLIAHTQLLLQGFNKAAP